MINENILYQLAKTQKWQEIYDTSKEYHKLIFSNFTELTPLQRSFLKWLKIINYINQDIINKEENAFEGIIDNLTRIEAYLYWKNLKHKKEQNKSKNNKPNREITETIKFVGA